MRDRSRPRKLELQDLKHRQSRRRLPRPLPLYVILDSVRSLWNVGSIFRTCDGARVREIFLCGITGRPPRPEISKTALGAEDTVSWSHHRDPAKVVVMLQSRGVPVWVLEQTRGSQAHSRAPLELPLALVAGNEIHGVSRGVIARADGAIEIPLLGTKESLNVSVAVGIALFEILRRNHGGAC